MANEYIYITAKVEKKQISITAIDGCYKPYFSLSHMFDTLRKDKIQKVFMADTQIQFSYILDYAKKNDIKIYKMIQHNGLIYSFFINGIRFISCDNIYNAPFDILCDEFNLGKPSGKAVYQLVNYIEALGEKKFSFRNGDYLTIGGLSWKWLTKGFCGNHTDIMGAKYNNHFNMKQWEFFRQNNIYKGGLCLINDNFRGEDAKGLYKYDVNSFFLWVMTTCNMPIGKYYRHCGKPDTLKDKVVCVRLTGTTKYPGIATLPGSLGFCYESIINEVVWLWGEELEELMEWNDLEVKYLEYLQWHWNEPDEEFRKFAFHFFPQKKVADGIRRRGVKLIINNSYGKWGQNPIQHTYSLSGGEWKESKQYIDYKNGVRSLAVASRITAMARTELLRRIRKATNNQPDKYFVYGDTDSMILTIPLEETDIGDGLGMWKFEGWFEKGVFLGKKCYLLYDGEEYEAHACGVNRGTLQQALLGKSWEEAREIFDYDKEFMCPAIVSGKGGKYRTLVPRKLSRGYEPSNFNIISGCYEQGGNLI